MADTVLEVHKLVKNYGSFRAVDEISFSVPQGKTIGFLGPNGAGKTTTIQILLGLTLPSAGQIFYFGKDFSNYRCECLQKINSASAFNTLLERMTVKENLLVFAGLYDVSNSESKIKSLLDQFEIPDLRDTPYRSLSTGQKTRVNIVKSLLNDPEILLMDEPTASLDPDIADKTLTLIEDLRRIRELSILYTSHNMEEITRICDEVIFLDHGKIVAQDTPLGLTKRIPSVQVQITIDTGREQIELYLQEKKHEYTFSKPHVMIAQVEESMIPKFIFGIGKTGATITDIEIRKPNLEDIFLQIARGPSHVA
ncbi:MAG: ABC transporter ATP-binding protein [Candidatus Roizmanbacteria bacterium]